VRAAWISIALAGCGSGAGSRHDHAPVDPALTMAIVAPASMKRVTTSAVFVERRRARLSAEAWAAELREGNPSFDVPTPTASGDGFEVTLRSPERRPFTAWYRSIGPIGIECVALAPGQERITRAACFGTQVHGDGILVPFALEGVTTWVQTALVDEPRSTTAEITIDPTRMPATDAILRDQQAVERGTLADGWWLVSHRDRMDRHEMNVQRTINGVGVRCSGYEYGSNEYDAAALVRRNLATCLTLEAPGDVRPTVPPADAALPDAPRVDALPIPTSLSGPANGEAMARAFVTAVAAADEPAMRALLLTPEINRAFYRCDDRPDYPMDERSREAMEAAMETLELGRALVRDQARVELGAWTETYRKNLAPNESVTFVCDANRGLAIAMGDLTLTVIEGKRRTPMVASFLFVEGMGSARISQVTIE
jgi:hypothetical protein